MNWWPFGRTEARSSTSYTDLLYQVAARATGTTTATAAATGALEACAGAMGRAFAAADVQAPGYAQAALTPDVLILIGRSLIRSGEVLFLLDVADAGSSSNRWPIGMSAGPMRRQAGSSGLSCQARRVSRSAPTCPRQACCTCGMPSRPGGRGRASGRCSSRTWRAGCRPKRPRRWPTKRAGRGVPCCLSPLTATIRPSRN